MEIKDAKVVWVVWQNTDLTEGRGFEEPIRICDSYETAVRLGKGKNVQGSDCRVSKEPAFLIEGTSGWFSRVSIESESAEDRSNRMVREKREAILEKARQVLTEEEIALLNR